MVIIFAKIVVFYSGIAHIALEPAVMSDVLTIHL